MRFHIPAYVHLPVAKRYLGCAFTQKIYNLSKMLVKNGHEVYVYGAEGSDVECTEFIQTHTLKEIRDTWGEGNNLHEIGYDWKEKGFKHDFNEQKTELTLSFYDKCVEAINERKKDDDFLLVMQGVYHKPIADKIELYLTVEPGVGYRGSYTSFKAFESAYLRNFYYGSKDPFKSVNGNWYDRVIPNYFDPEDFEMNEDKEDWFLFIGRVIPRKGLDIAIKAVDAIGGHLKVAGQGVKYADNNKIVGHEGTFKGESLEYVGYADREQRKLLLSKAKGVFVPTIYLEAFGGVNVEAQLSGTPVITTDYGVFPETVVHGVTGFRCNTLQDFVSAAREIDTINPWHCRSHAEQYLMDNVYPLFEKWFTDLYHVYESTKNPSVRGWNRIE